MRAAPISAPFRPGADERPSRRASLLLPDQLCKVILRVLDGLALRLASLGVSANAITATCIVLGATSGILLGAGQFTGAAGAMALASLGDALDGLVARRSGTVSVSGALLDAAGDRYQEFFFLGGLAVLERGSVVALVVVLSALAGGFMVSYGSAKAEALGMTAPRGVMRRPERAVCVCVAAGLSSPWAWWVRASQQPTWFATLPLLGAAAIIGMVANASAIRRLWFVAHCHPISSPCAASRIAGAPTADAGRVGALGIDRSKAQARHSR